MLLTTQNEKQTIKVLIIDDDIDMREVMQEILTQEGFKTATAASGREAIKACQREDFDIGLIDIKLPDINGVALLQSISKLNPAMIKIVMTGYPSIENAVQSLNLGAQGYIVKPFKPEKLLEQIQTQLQKHRVGHWEELLMNTGLSSYEAKIYLALALTGQSEASKISLAAGVPRTKAYSALKKLVQRGMIIEVPGKQQNFAIASPSDAFEAVIQNWKIELSEQEKKLVDLERTISILDQCHQKNEVVQTKLIQQEIWLIKGKEEITQRTAEMLSVAKNSVTLTTTEKGLINFYKSFRKLLDSLSEKGIKMLINIPIESGSSSLINELAYAYDVQKKKLDIPILLLVVDNEQFLLNREINDNSTDEEELALFAQSKEMVGFVSTLLGNN